VIAVRSGESVCDVRALFLCRRVSAVESKLRVPSRGKDAIRLNSQRKSVYKGSVQAAADLNALLKTTEQFHIHIHATGSTPAAAVSCQATKE
jgi:hypothetical protein